MITADQCEKAAELLAERLELIEPLAAMRTTKKVRIAYQHETPARPGNPPTPPHVYWRDGPEVDINPTLRKLLLGGIETELAAIDAKLRALGVEPPKDGGGA